MECVDLGKVPKASYTYVIDLLCDRWYLLRKSYVVREGAGAKEMLAKLFWYEYFFRPTAIIIYNGRYNILGEFWFYYEPEEIVPRLARELIRLGLRDVVENPPA